MNLIECLATFQDLDQHDKQNWPAVMRIFSDRTCKFLMEKIHTAENGDSYRGMYVYCEMGRMLLNAWFAEAEPGWEPQQSIEDAACVLACAVAWRSEIASGHDLHLKTDTLTRETILDTITSCQTCILRFPLFRDHYPQWKPYGPNFGQSRFSEYGFQWGRMRCENTTSLSQKGFFTAFGHLNYQTFLEASSGLKIPSSHRGVPHSIERVQPDPPPPGFFPDDDEQMKFIETGFDRARFLYNTVCAAWCSKLSDTRVCVCVPDSLHTVRAGVARTRKQRTLRRLLSQTLEALQPPVRVAEEIGCAQGGRG
jgi:hypothetical protein